MKTKRRYLIGGLVVAIAFGVLLWQAFSMFGSYSLTVSQFLEKQRALGISVTEFSQAASPNGGEVTVHGWVTDASAFPGAGQAGFAITDGRENIAVAYTGGLSSTLAPGAEVVVKGTNNNGVLYASRVTTTKEVRIEGPLSGDVPVEYDIDTRTTKFAITDTADMTGTRQAIPVVYTGAVPDTFFIDVKRVDVSMVAIGREGPNGVFHASQILTKCASKYEAATTPSPAAQ